jgi:hypothetical protein
VQRGLTAQDLRFFDLVLEYKWFLPLDGISDGELFYVLDGFRSWHDWIREEMRRLAAASPTWFRRKRPGTAYQGMALRSCAVCQ